MKAVAYIRVSTDDQALGPDAQRAAIEAWAMQTGAVVVSWREDIGISGTAKVDRRPGLLDAIEDLRQHGATVLVVAKRDRLARDVFAAATVEQLCRKAGATIQSAAGEPAGDGPEAQLMRHILDAFAEYEVALIRARTRAALRVKARRGERTGSVPLGCKLAKDGIRLEVDGPEAQAVAMAKGLRDRGVSLPGIATALDEAGHVTRKGKAWHPEQVRRMVSRAVGP